MINKISIIMIKKQNSFSKRGDVNKGFHDFICKKRLLNVNMEIYEPEINFITRKFR